MVDWQRNTQRQAWAFAGVVLLLAVGACTAASPPTRESESPQPGASTAAGESAPPSTVPTPEPTPGFEAPAGILPPGSRAVVTRDGLRVREQPGLNAAVVDTLAADTVVNISGVGPTLVDGLDWYGVDTTEPVRFGYAAAGSNGVRYLELLPARCEDGEPDLAALLRITPWERLACFGDRSLVITGTFGCPVCGEYVPGTYNPGWLASPENLNYLGWPDALLTLHFDPAMGLNPPPRASIVRVTGHFSDPASSTCVIEPPGEPVVPADPVIAELYCREQFVVDGYEVIGTNPDFT